MLVLSQLVGLDALRARVPAALRRAIDQLHAALDGIAEPLGGVRARAPAIGVLTRWPDTASAVRFASRLQLDLLEREWPSTLLLRPEAAEWRGVDGSLLYRGPRLRIAIHRGHTDETAEEEGHPLVGGPAAYQVARILAVAHGGQIVVSEAAWTELADAVPEDVVATDLGMHRLIGIQGETRLIQVLPRSVAQRTFPPLASRDTARTNAPTLRPGLVGRDGDLQALVELTGFGVRVVTLTGAPGVGRSALLERFVAVHGSAWGGPDRGGAWWCQVEGTRTEHVITSVALAMGLSLRFGRSVDELLRQLGNCLRGMGPMLLAIDGGAAPAAALAEAVRSWLGAAPELRLMVCAPGRLGVAGEITYDVGPLAPATVEGGRNDDAVRLLTARASLAKARTGAIDPGLAAAIANLVGGLPASLVLAGGLLAETAPDQLAGALETLDGSLDSVVDLTWTQLRPEDRHVLGGCAMYPGGFDHLDAEAVIDTARTAIVASEAIERLLRTGLLGRVDDPRTPEVRRYRVEPRVRDRALAELPPDLRLALERQAAEQVVARCEQWAAAAWGRDGNEVLARMAVEQGNLARVAMRGRSAACGAPDVDLALRALIAGWPMVATAGPAGLFIDLATQVLERAELVLECDSVLHARALAARAGARRNVGDLAGAVADAERGAEMAVRWGDPQAEGHCRLMAGLARFGRGRFAEAGDDLQHAANCLAEADPGHAAVARGALAVVRLEQGRFEEASDRVTEAIATLERLGWDRHLGLQLSTLGLVHRRAGRVDEARTCYDASAAIHARIGDRRALGVCLVNRASLEIREGELDRAVGTLGAALRACQETGDRTAESRVHGNLALASLARGATDVARDHLLSALAIDRELRDRVAEATDVAWLGVAHQVAGQPEAAVDAYRQALQGLDDRAPARLRGPVDAWLALALATTGFAGEVEAHLERAAAWAAESREPGVSNTVEVLAATARAVLEPSLLDAARRTWEQTRDEHDVEVVLARRVLAATLGF